MDAADDELAALLVSLVPVERYFKKGERGAPYNLVPFCANLADDDFVIRLTADNPLLDPRLVQRLIEEWPTYKKYFSGGLCTRSDLYSESSFPPGMDAELFSVDAIRNGWGMRKSDTRFLYERHRVGLLFDHEWMRPGLNLSVDWPQDLWMCRRALENLGEDVPSYEDIVEAWNEGDEGNDGEN